MKKHLKCFPERFKGHSSGKRLQDIPTDDDATAQGLGPRNFTPVAKQCLA